MQLRNVGYVAVGVDRTGGLLPDLKGAAAGAHAVADWLDGQASYGMTVNGKTLTDRNGGMVTVRDVQDAITEQVKLQPDILVLFFSGHGIAKSGGDEQLVLSEAGSRPDEAIQITATREDGRYLGIPHVLIICDACRNAIDPYTELGRVNGRSVLTRGPVAGGQKGKVDIFYATEASQTAKESSGEGVFTQVLLETLLQPPEGVCETWPEFSSPVIPAWTLEDYLLKEVPKRARKACSEQTPDFILTSRRPMFVGMAADTAVKNITNPVPRKKITLPAVPEQPDDVVAYEISRGISSPMAITPKAAASLMRKQAFKASMPTIDPWLLSMARKGDGPFRDQIEAQLPFSVGVNCTYLIKLVEIEDVLYDKNQLDFGLKRQENGTLIRLARIAPVSGMSAPRSVVVLLKEGTFFFLPVIDGYRGVISAPGGLLRSITLASASRAISVDDIAAAIEDAGPDSASESALKVRRGVAAELAMSGRLHHLQKVVGRELRRALSDGPTIDPTLALYACYALALRSDEVKLSEILMDIERQAQPEEYAHELSPLIFDFNLMRIYAGANVPPRASAPALPMFGLGWSYLGPLAEQLGVHPTVVEAGHQRLNCEWTTFRRDYGRTLIEMFERGDLQ